MIRHGRGIAVCGEGAQSDRHIQYFYDIQGRLNWTCAFSIGGIQDMATLHDKSNLWRVWVDLTLSTELT
jgi:hypothetical protein